MKYEINEHGVVLNPKIVLNFNASETHRHYMRIKVANAGSTKRWDYSAHVMLPIQGFSGPCCAIENEERGFKTEEEAVKHAEEEIKEYLEKAENSEERDKMLKYLENQNQMSLF